MTKPRMLIAGIGNIFLGDDAFGVEVAQRLAKSALPDGVRVVDFGVRGRDLAYALLDGYDGAILIDATSRGQVPGTLYVLAPDWHEFADGPAAGGGHVTDMVSIVRLAQSLAGRMPTLRVVGCEPAQLEESIGLSEPVRAAVDEAVRLVEELVREMSEAVETQRCTS